MKPTILVALLVLTIPFSVAAPVFYFNMSNATQDSFSQIDFMNTSTMVNWDTNMTHTNWNIACQYKGTSGTVPSCFTTQTGTVVANSSYKFGTDSSLQVSMTGTDG